MADPSGVCVSCQTPLPSDAQFCPRCGAATPTHISGGGTTTFGATPNPSAERRHEIQEALGPDYVVEHCIGSGGFAEVWAATDKKLQRRVAVKVLHPELVASRSLIERFEREAQAVAKLRHPGVIPIYAVGRHEDLAYYVMPLVEGESLRDRLNREGALPPDEVRRILRDVAVALAVAHKAGIVHRDIKPENLMLEGEDRRVLVMDFGIAKDTAGAQTGLTGTGMIVGTPAYMSPEQATATKEIDARSDVYSLGIVGFELLTGKPPFKADSVPELIVQHVTTQPPRIEASFPDAPRDLVIAIERCLEKDPASRWPDAGALAAALADATSSATGEIRTQRAGPRSRRVAVTAGVVVGALALAAAVLWTTRRPHETLGPDVRPRQVTFRGDVGSAYLSPSGQLLVFSSGRRFWAMDLDRDSTWEVPGLSDDQGISFSPGGTWTSGGEGFVYRTFEGTWVADLRSNRTSMVGPQEAADSLTAMRGIVARVDVFVPDSSSRDSTAGVTVRRLGGPRLQFPFRGLRVFMFESQPSLNPRDERLLASYTVAVIDSPTVATDTVAHVLVGSRDGAMSLLEDPVKWLRLPEGDRSRFGEAAWTSDGVGVYMRWAGQGLWRFDLESGGGHIARASRLLPGVDLNNRSSDPRCPDGQVRFARARDRLALVRADCYREVVVGRLNLESPSGGLKVEGLRLGLLRPEEPSPFPGGDRLLFVSPEDSGWGLYSAALPSGASRRVGLVAEHPQEMQLSPDGLTAAFVTRSQSGLSLSLADVRRGVVRRVWTWRSESPASRCGTFGWAADARHLFLVDSDSARQGDVLVRLDAVSGAADTIVPPDEIDRIYCPSASPDGLWVMVGSYGGDLTNRPRRLLLSTTGVAPRVIDLREPVSQVLGWASPSQLLALEPISQDSTSVVLIPLAGPTRILGNLPAQCGTAKLSGDRRTLVCVRGRVVSDVWIADGFDPALRK